MEIREAHLQKFTVIWVDRSEGSWEYLNCLARTSDHAQEICERLYTHAEVVWVNEGHDETSMTAH